MEWVFVPIVGIVAYLYLMARRVRATRWPTIAERDQQRLDEENRLA